PLSTAAMSKIYTSLREKCPFSDIELEALQAALNDSFATGRVSLENYVLAWLAIALGPRPTQLAMLKIADFRVATSNDGTPMYALRVPRAKQRGIGARSQFTEEAERGDDFNQPDHGSEVLPDDEANGDVWQARVLRASSANRLLYVPQFSALG